MIDGASEAGRGGEHDLSDLAAGLLLVELVFGLQKAVGAELVIVEEAPEEAHDLSVVLLLHGDKQDCALNDAKVLQIGKRLP